MFIDYAAKAIRGKIIYWGPPGSGKWTNLSYVFARTAPADSPPPDKASSVGFPLTLGPIRGFTTVIVVLRVPDDGPSMQWVLDEAAGRATIDGVVFVADSSPDAAHRNVASAQGLVEALRTRGLDAAKLPMVVQYNKRDVPGALALDVLRADVNPWGHAEQEATATSGAGVFDSLKTLTKLVLAELRAWDPGN